MPNTNDTGLDRRAVPPSPEPAFFRPFRPSLAPGRILLLLAVMMIPVFLTLLPFLVKESELPQGQALLAGPVNVTSGDELIGLLKEKGLWEIAGNFAVPRMILSSYPANIGALDPEAKKKAFLNSLLPAALVAMAEVEKEKESLHAILVKLPADSWERLLTEPVDVWPVVLGKPESEELFALCRKYRTDRVDELLKRVEVVPISLLMAQAALESSWGGSRIAREGNNLFGVVTWGDDAVPPPGGSDGSGQRYASYGSILESVRAYVVMLNRLPSYQRFREIRSRSRDPQKMAEGLKNYSERRSAYVGDIKEVMLVNRLDRYDGCFLAQPAAPPARADGPLGDLWKRLDWTTRAVAI